MARADAPPRYSVDDPLLRPPDLTHLASVSDEPVVLYLSLNNMRPMIRRILHFDSATPVLPHGARTSLPEVHNRLRSTAHEALRKPDGKASAPDDDDLKATVADLQTMVSSLDAHVAKLDTMIQSFMEEQVTDNAVCKDDRDEIRELAAVLADRVERINARLHVLEGADDDAILEPLVDF